MLPLDYKLGDKNRKRPHEYDDDSSGEIAKRVINKSYLRLVVNCKSLRNLIGKAGSTIDEIRKSTEVDIVIDDSFIPFENLPERFITCCGFVDNIVSALSLLLKRMPFQYDHVEEGDVCEYLIIPTSEAGKLLGVGGESIKNLRNETNTNISVSNDLESPSDRKNRSIRISGKEQNVENAIARIKTIVKGYTLEEYPESVSIRVAVPVQSIPLLFPEDSLHDSLLAYSHVSIHPAPFEDTITGYRTQGVDLSGPTHEVVEVSKLIEKLVSEWIDFKVINPLAIVLKILVNLQVAGSVIGKGGTNLHAIQHEFHVKVIPVHSPCYTTPDLERMFYLVGAPEAIVQAVNFLLNKLVVYPIERRMPVDIKFYQGIQSDWPSYPDPFLPPMVVPMASPYGGNLPHGIPQSLPQGISQGNLMLNSMGYEYYPISYASTPCEPTVHYQFISGSLQEGRVVVSVPTDLCGRILGKRGVVVVYIKTSTACDITIEKRETMNNQAASRRITIEGPAEGIVRAM